MKILPVTKKPVYPNTTLNSLLTAKRLAVARENDQLRLDFRDITEVLNFDDQAPRGSFSPNYNVVSSLFELDPTAILSTARSAIEIRNPVARVGRTSIHREMMYKTATSAIVGQWWRDFNILYRMAKDAETRRDNVTTDKKLHRNLDVEDTDGFVEMFLCAVGDIDDTLMRYPVDKAVDVDSIYTQVVARMLPLMESLDHYGFQKGFDTYANVAGEGSLPGATGERLFTLPARTFDGLGRAPFRALLRNPRARELIRDTLTSRFDAALEAVQLSQYSAGDQDLSVADSRFAAFGEGDDLIILPLRATAPANVGSFTNGDLHAGPFYASGDAMLDDIVATIDAMDDLATAHYQNSGDNPAAVDDIRNGWWWTQQFYNLGDLVIGLFDGSIDSDAPSYLNVRVRTTAQAPIGQDLIGLIDDAVVDTGPLWTVNFSSGDVINIITGSTDVVDEPRWTAPLDGVTSISLPTGILNIGSPADMNAVQLIRWLTLLRDMWSADHEALMILTSRNRRVLPKASSVSMKGSTTAIGDMIIQSQIRGTRLPLQPSFNKERHELPQQHGCFSYPVNQELEPVVFPSSRGWGVRDFTTAVDMSLQGQPFGIEVAPSRITGQMSNGRASGWLPGGIPGTRDSTVITKDIMSMPLTENGRTNIYGSEIMYDDGLNVIGLGAVQDWEHPGIPTASAPGAYSHVRESHHPLLDYLPGFFSIAGEGSGLGLMNPTPNYEQISRTDGGGNVVYNNMNSLVHNQANGNATVVVRAIVGPASLAALTEIEHSLAYAISNSASSYVYGTDATDVPKHEGWFWDPGYAQVIGNSCHRLSGLSMNDASWLHPYVAGPISVFASYVPLADLTGTVDWEDRQGRVLALTNNLTMNGTPLEYSAITGAMTSLGVTQMGYMIAGNGTNLDTGYAHAKSVIPMNSPDVVLSKMSSANAMMQAQAVRDGFPGLIPGNRMSHIAILNSMSLSALPTTMLIHSLPNSVARNPMLKFGAYGTLGFEGTGRAMVDTPIHNFGYNTVQPQSTEYSVWQGETLLPSSGVTHSDAGNQWGSENVVAAVIATDFVGLCGEYEDYQYMTSPTAWYVNHQAGTELSPGGSILGGSITGYNWLNEYNGRVIATATEVAPQTGVPLLEADYDALAPFGQGAINVNTPASPYPSTLSSNPWFSRRLDRSGSFVTDLNYRALQKKRKNIYSNPWTDKDSGSSRLFDSKYDSSEISAVIEAIRRAHVSEGAKMTEGLTKDAFLTLQITN